MTGQFVNSSTVGLDVFKMSIFYKIRVVFSIADPDCKQLAENFILKVSLVNKYTCKIVLL